MLCRLDNANYYQSCVSPKAQGHLCNMILLTRFYYTVVFGVCSSRSSEWARGDADISDGYRRWEQFHRTLQPGFQFSGSSLFLYRSG